jgi:hypothetical protein
MYELTCPDCRNVMKTPFVRVGAVATCAKCKRQFPVTADGVRRVSASPGAAAAGLAGAMAGASAVAASNVAGAAADEFVPATLDTPDSPTASAPPIVSREPARETPRPTVPEAARSEADEVADQLAPSSRRRPIRPVRNRQKGPLILLALVAVLLAAGVGIGVYAWMSQPVSTTQPGDAPDAAEPDAGTPAVELPTLDHGVRIVQAQTLVPREWKTRAIGDPPSQQAGPVTLEDARVEYEGGGEPGTFRARVVASSFDMFESVGVTIYLLNQDNQPIATTDASVKLLTSHRPQELEIAVPAELARETIEVDWRARPGPRLTSAVPYESRVVEPARVENNRTAFRIEAYNPLANTARRSLFLVTASDDGGRVVERWLVDWSEPVGPKQRVEVAVITALKPERRVAMWSITGVAVP